MNLNEQEIISLYENNLKIKSCGDTLPKRFLNSEYNCKVILSYVFKNKMKWDAKTTAKNLSFEFIRKHRLYGIYKKYKSSKFALIDVVFSSEIKPWQMSFVSNGYFELDQNKIDALAWFVEQLKLDNIINTEEDLPLIITCDLFKKYNLLGLLKGYFNYSPYQAINFIFPERWKPWEFREVPKKFWDVKKHRVEAMKWLIEEKLQIKKSEEIPSYIRNSFLLEDFCKFTLICSRYYKCNYFHWISEVYPDRFKPEDFKQIITQDKIKVDSLNEKIIHEWFMKNLNNCSIFYNGSRKNISSRFLNNDYNEEYIPDWIITRGNSIYIIEYFGWYDEGERSKNTLIQQYISKTHRKIAFFTKYCEENPQYFFISLFPSDYSSNLKGIKDKFNFLKN